MTSFTAEEARKRWVAKLGEETGTFFRNLENDLYGLRDLWRVYIGLFGANQERIDLLNSISGITAFLIEKIMLESVMLSICKLTDPEEGPRKSKNITIWRLPGYLTKGADTELEDLIKLAEEKSEFARTWRNKRIAHSDDDTRNGRSSLDVVNTGNIREATDAIATCIKRFAQLELDVDLVTHPISALGNDEVEFLQVLHYGKIELDRREKESRQVALSGDWKAGRELMELPEWLTFRPDHELDV